MIRRLALRAYAIALAPIYVPGVWIVTFISELRYAAAAANTEGRGAIFDIVQLWRGR